MLESLIYRIRFEKAYLAALLDRKRIKVGSIYEDCSYNLCVAQEVDLRNDYITGVRLKDGELRGCSPAHCTDGALSPSEIALKMKEA